MRCARFLLILAIAVARAVAADAQPDVTAPAVAPEAAPATPATPAADQAPPAPGAAAAGAGLALRPQVEEWPVPRLRWFSQQREKLSSAIFDLIDDVGLVDLKIGQGSVKLDVGRRVYDNHDVLNSWTVVDSFRIRTSYPLYSPTRVFGTGFTIGFRVGGRAGADLIDIRQVLPSHYQESTATAARLKEIERSQFYRLMLGEADKGKPPPSPAEEAEGGDEAAAGNDTWILYDNARGDAQAELVAHDGLTKARYTKLWNMLAYPCRIPLKAEWIQRMEVDEIISYNGYGMVELGPSVGWSLDLSGAFQTLGTDVSFTTFLRGDFRISIWREDERYAQVKLTRIASSGRNESINAETDDLFSGFALFGAQVNTSQSRIVPFSFTIAKGRGRAFDTVYRYDMASPDGRRAFERAVRGRFGLSDRFAGGREWRRAPADAPVHRLAIRHTDFASSGTTSEARYAFVYRHRHSARITDSDVVITTPDGVTRFFQSVVDDQELWRFVWGTSEEIDRDFRITVDLDRWEQGLPDALTLSLTGDITDTDTSGAEMNRYMDEIEEATGQAGFFPRPPIRFPSREFPALRHDEEHDRRLEPRDQGVSIEYGRSSFYYQVTYDQRQVERFLACPLALMWPAMERAYQVPPGAWSTRWRRTRWGMLHSFERLLNLPLYVINMNLREGSILPSADNALRHWRSAQEHNDVRERVQQLAAMFASRRYGGELSRLVRAVLADEKASWQISGSSEFGSFHDAGVSRIPIEPYPERLQRMIDFDRQRRRPVGDPNAVIGDLTVRMPDPRHLRLQFGVGGAAMPKTLYFRLDHRPPWRLPEVVREGVYINSKEIFQAGENQLLIDLDQGFMSDLFAGLIAGDRYELRMATSRDGTHWGSVSRARFEVPASAAAAGPEPRPGPAAPPPAPVAAPLPVDPLPSRDPGGSDLGAPPGP